MDYTTKKTWKRHQISWIEFSEHTKDDIVIKEQEWRLWRESFRWISMWEVEYVLKKDGEFLKIFPSLELAKECVENLFYNN